MLELAFRLDLPHGRCVGMVIPAVLPHGALATLHSDERALAEGLPEARQRTFVAGRLALRAALMDLGLPAEPLLISERGAPLLPPGALGSISHKRTLAVGLAARAGGQQIGVDIEDDTPPRIDVSRRVLTNDEAAALASTAPELRARAVLMHLSAKESIYKALDPFVRRHVSFKEASLALRGDGTWQVTLALTGNEGPFSTEVTCQEIQAAAPFLLTTAAIRPA
jgi:4'-phosphopantetheinyl transferase EntD